jgi:hypothetical protein
VTASPGVDPRRRARGRRRAAVRRRRPCRRPASSRRGRRRPPRPPGSPPRSRKRTHRRTRGRPHRGLARARASARVAAAPGARGRGRAVAAQDADKASISEGYNCPRGKKSPHIHRFSGDSAMRRSSIGGRSRLSVTEDANPPVARGNDRQHVPKWQTSGGPPAAAPPLTPVRYPVPVGRIRLVA